MVCPEAQAAGTYSVDYETINKRERHSPVKLHRRPVITSWCHAGSSDERWDCKTVRASPEGSIGRDVLSSKKAALPQMFLHTEDLTQGSTVWLSASSVPLFLGQSSAKHNGDAVQP
ncbi:hypothetical protein VFPPC_17634 [Pochonia chlamydosporia 170]|uniref:Uncharacterized protein n=1 Tax=Pochonia chlamydosporia 170 TaxID=1380566 RepID=A0A219AQZ6_METCM|nr:hypothetical protein VFPPC_17634 [Pochonia chlamydosporia 170]OWT43190.1 hypothetical protein VFPPC_17634 [Pochonia chlamydosporia 170]